jgi:hypothetical protein
MTIEEYRERVNKAHTRKSPPMWAISISRHIDPSTYIDEIVECLKAGHICYINPHFAPNRKIRASNYVFVSLRPHKVAVLSLFSKDYTKFLAAYEANRDLFRQYLLHFSFTINSDMGTKLEPGVETTLDNRLKQLETLCNIVKSRNGKPDDGVSLHCGDPIVMYRETKDGPIKHNVGDMGRIVSRASELGLRRMGLSFCNAVGGWKHVYKQFHDETGYDLYMLDLVAREAFLRKHVLPICVKYGVTPMVCDSDNIVLAERIDGLERNKCLDGDRINRLRVAANLQPARFRKGGKKEGCQCIEFRDVGAYRTCVMDCTYCFAKRNQRRAEEQVAAE